jgi:PhnB protein
MGKHRLVPHLIVDGGLDAAGFYERAFGAEKAGVMMAKDGKRVLHAELEVNGGAFKLSGSFPEMAGDMAAPGTAGGISASLHLDFKKPKQVDEAIEQAVKARGDSDNARSGYVLGRPFWARARSIWSYLGFSRATYEERLR